MRRMVFPYLLPLTSHSLLLTLFMLQTVIQNIIRFVVLVLVQVLVLNHVQFLGFVNPYVYVLFILSLPVRTPPTLRSTDRSTPVSIMRTAAVKARRSR